MNDDDHSADLDASQARRRCGQIARRLLTAFPNELAVVSMLSNGKCVPQWKVYKMQLSLPRVRTLFELVCSIGGTRNVAQHTGGYRMRTV